MAGRTLGLERATNARDLGGYVTGDGRRVRTGRLYRSNALHRLTDADLDALGHLGLACVIDFRHPHEIELIGPDRLPDTLPARLVSLPLFDPSHDVFTLVSGVLTGRADPRAVDALRDGGGVGAMREIYRWFVTSVMAREAFGAAVRLIADRSALPLLFHCTAGKDRTGWLAAIVLTVLGVDPATILDDYLRTNELSHTVTAYVMAAVAGRIAEPELLLPLLEARAEYLDEAYAMVAKEYGSFDGYLADGLGLEPATLDQVRTNFLH